MQALWNPYQATPCQSCLVLVMKKENFWIKWFYNEWFSSYHTQMFCFHLWCENCFVVHCTTKQFPHQLCLWLHHTQDSTIPPHPPPTFPVSSLWWLGCWGTPSGGLLHWLSPIQAARSLFFLDHRMPSQILFIHDSSFSHPSCQLPLAAWVLRNWVWWSSSLVISVTLSSPGYGQGPLGPADIRSATRLPPQPLGPPGVPLGDMGVM